ncbi:serine phosphatase RsbU (regulator of sigma subunit) [Streptacidiphilus sp. MAP12-20]|uniref:PP2C family protein-serine/threonine phosphatase n=1 Tax=Streptacidiphilus sp. MAP12-20 TaxID=3156299 RepID=UPI0035166A55
MSPERASAASSPGHELAREPDRESAEAVRALGAELADLRARLRRRHLLDLAAGVLVARQGTEPVVAADTLAELALGADLTVEELAADIVNQACGAEVGAGAGSPAGDEARVRRRAGSMAEAGADLDEVVQILHQEYLAEHGVQGLLVWQRTADDCLVLAGSVGFPVLARAHWSRIPPQWPAVPRQVLATGAPLWLPDGVEEAAALPGPAPQAARAVLPLRNDGVPVGIALLTWAARRALEPALQRRVTGMLEVLGRLLARMVATGEPAAARPVLVGLLDELSEPALMLRSAEVSGGSSGGNGSDLHVEYLNGPAQRFGSGVPRPVGRPLAQVLPQVSGEVSALVAEARRSGTVERRERLPAAGLADGPEPMLNVRVLVLGGERCVVLWHRGSHDHSFSVLQRAGRLGALAAFEDDLALGESRWSEQVAACLGLPPGGKPFPLAELGRWLLTEDRSELRAMIETLTIRLEGASAILRLSRQDGGVRHVRVIAEPLLTHGTLTGITGFFQDVSIQHQTEAALAATFDELGSVQAKAAIRHRLALQLQQAIVPELPSRTELARVEVAARYRPAAEEYRVGGDWYDVLRLPDDQVMIAVGDVAGHGIDAATGMVALRNALRGLACSGERPGQLMHWLNEVTLRTAGHPTATAICARFDPPTRRLRWTSAGHLPPLLLREGRARLLRSAPNLLLGATADVSYRESQARLHPGDLLLLFTDGLIERRHAALDDTLVILRQAAESLEGSELDSQADQLLAAATGDTDDDASLVLFRVS